MFSYRHAFHAGNHADVLKHTTLIALMKYLTQKDTALTVIDTHAGAGLYRLDGDYTETSGEAQEGIFRLVSASKTPTALAASAPAATKKVATQKTPGAAKAAADEPLAPALQDYVDLLRSLNPQFAASGDPAQLKIYPGSPFIEQQFLSGRDKLKLFELHPTDFKSLTGNIAQLGVGRQVTVACEDGFEVLKTFLPPPARRAMVLCDPSYEIKSDYARVAACMGDAVKRFATGTYVVWYPIIPRPEAHDLPRKLKTLATKAGRSWLNATLTVKSSKLTTDEAGDVKRPGLPASGMFVINPPHTLKADLQAALPQLVARLGQDRNAGFTLDHGG
ncbi:MAG: 23S rRNA (adenine(2030)-N(6))-methyltransferase RlmJ [Polaromonas sp.]|uniref:23S rRNA (adenine(2030)-N(6))-methyltransferase RlmJ n=1 Tax=Polaromonas sp. TaxID=1869339 RepID=UPI002715A4B4|nr:23S rRNA (adenine(2030)-N(6))-methyltransferase RlmJ [Polaromonas sp.]MDO9116070.1 23S rRNA (adenine(2030)-N(6))-methyltransferase RlmJ [Polaromonas sp.]MDP1888041.1 23S rRNA (adenine(2030)-N(6))-methyltransferase RlmJ [Polaromonas sp.]